MYENGGGCDDARSGGLVHGGIGTGAGANFEQLKIDAIRDGESQGSTHAEVKVKFHADGARSPDEDAF